VEGVELVTSRKARRHYGVLCMEPFDESVHSPKNRLWDEHEEMWYADNQITWYIKKGDTVVSGEPTLMEFMLTHEKTTSKHSSTLVCSVANKVPKEYDAGDSLTSILCKTSVDMRKVPHHLWRSRCSPSGRPYKTLAIEVGMNIESGRLTFDLRVDDVVYGVVDAKFE